MQARKLLRINTFYILSGFILGFVLFLFDRWLDSHQYSFVYSWSIIILAIMIFGGVIGNLLQRILNEQRKREETILKENKRLNDLFGNLPGIVSVLEESGKRRFVNRNYVREFGEPEGKIGYEVLGRKNLYDDCFSEDRFDNEFPIKIDELYQNNRVYEVILQPYIDVDGSKLVIETLYDITERKKSEQELSRMQANMAHLERLNLVGRMAAGIAHEIRNPMTTVRGYLQLMEEKPEFQSNSSRFKLMIEELDRANSIITEFLTFAKIKPLEMHYQNINLILQHLYPLLEADAFSQNKRIVFEAGETPNILLDANEISQLVLNICRNGLDAMQVDGTLTIHTFSENEQVILSVEDEGYGIQPENLDKLGTPFFTTKDNGTGLGLAICYSIAERHHARIDVESDSGGTTFSVRFPSNVY